MPFCPYNCPFMNQFNNNLRYDDDQDVEEQENFDGAFRSPNGPNFPFFPGQGGGSNFNPNFGPPSGGGQDGPPGPPPSKNPTKKSSFGGPTLKAVDPGAIRPCRYQFVYIWPTYGRPFWAWLTFVGPRSAAGFRWNGRNWRYFGIDLRQIESFECY